MNPTLTIYLIRHTEPLISTGICYGQLDCSVTEDYVKQFANISHYFNDKKIDAIYSSPLYRCALLAEDLAKQHFHCSVIYRDAFKEINFGDWEGQKWNDIGREKIEQWNENRLHFQFPNGETPFIFIQRVLKEYASLQSLNNQTQENKTIVLVTHAGVLRTILGDIMDLTFTETLNLKIDKASISLIVSKHSIQKVDFINMLPQ